MVGILGICDHCRLIYDTEWYEEVWLDGVNFRCPRCRKDTIQPTASYECRNGSMELVAGPEHLTRLINKIKHLAAKAEDEQIEPHEIIAEIVKIDPNLARKLTKHVSKKRIFFAALLYAAVEILSIEVKIDMNDFLDRIDGRTEKFETSPAKPSKIGHDLVSWVKREIKAEKSNPRMPVDVNRLQRARAISQNRSSAKLASRHRPTR